MYLLVKDDKQVFFDGEVEKESVVIGRGSDCDIRCFKDVISRRHLEIKKENEQIFIKKMASNNWVILNKEKVETDDYLPYYNFYDLCLPGEITILVKLEVENEATNLIDAPVERNLLNPKISRSPMMERSRRPRSSRRRKTDLNDALDPVTMLMGAALLGFWTFYLLTSKIPFVDPL